MEKVWLLQHQVSWCCEDIFLASARLVFLRELLCCSWRLAEAYGPNSNAMKLSCRTMLFASDVTQLKSNEKSTDSTSARLDTRSLAGGGAIRRTWRFSLLLMPLTMVFTLALAHTLPMVPNCILIRAIARLVGVSVLPQPVFNYAQEHI